MQELLGRIARLDPSASLGLRVIACFDELVVGNVNTHALLSAAASLAGCVAGYRQATPPSTLRVTPSGTRVATDATDIGSGPDLAREPIHALTDPTGALTVWLERDGDPLPNDAIILERLALALRVRRLRGPRDLDNRRQLGVAVDATVTTDERLAACAALGLQPGLRHRVVVAPLFAVWRTHPDGAEDVVATPFGPIHTLVLPASTTEVDAAPVGIGTAVRPVDLPASFRTALVALRLCDPPAEPFVLADSYGGLVDLLAETGTDGQHGDADKVARLTEHAWGLPTVRALVTSQTVREAARQLDVHHSTLQARLETVVHELGFDPQEGFGRSRLATAYLVHRLRTSRVLDLPAPTSRLDTC